MNSTSLPVLVLAVALGAVSAAATTFLLQAPDSGDPREASPLLAAPGTSSEAELLAQIQDLRQRLTALELRPVPAVRFPAAGSVSMEDLEALEEDLRESLAIPKAPIPPPAQFKNQVAEALTSIRKDEAVLKAEASYEKRVAQREERLAKVTDWLALDAYQVDDMRAIMTAKDEGERELIRMWREGVDGEVLGEAKRTNRDETQAALARVLTPDQLETYRAGFRSGGKQ